MNRFYVHIIFIPFLMMLFVDFVSAQEPQKLKKLKQPKYEIVDTSRLAVIYVHRTYDPVLDLAKAPDEMLLIGDKFSMYRSYGNYKLDSLLSENPDMTYKEYKGYHKEFDSFQDNLIKSYDSGTLRYGGWIFMNSYKYTEEIPKIQWKLGKGRETILGKICRKATCRFRGRDWTAWYCPDIPIGEGPWKFGGLPGVILKMEDSKGEHLIEATEIRKASIPFGYPQKLYVKSTREKYLKELADYKNDPLKSFESAGTVAKDKDGNIIRPRRKKLFYNPIELE